MVWIKEDKRLRSDCHRFIIYYSPRLRTHLLYDKLNLKLIRCRDIVDAKLKAGGFLKPSGV